MDHHHPQRIPSSGTAFRLAPFKPFTPLRKGTRAPCNKQLVLPSHDSCICPGHEWARSTRSTRALCASVNRAALDRADPVRCANATGVLRRGNTLLKVHHGVCQHTSSRQSMSESRSNLGIFFCLPPPPRDRRFLFEIPRQSARPPRQAKFSRTGLFGPIWLFGTKNFPLIHTNPD